MFHMPMSSPMMKTMFGFFPLSLVLPPASVLTGSANANNSPFALGSVRQNAGDVGAVAFSAVESWLPSAATDLLDNSGCREATA